MNRRHRLRSRAAFATVRTLRASASTESLRIGVAPNGDRPARVGFAVPRAVGGAVVRNRVRRRLRAALSSRLAGLEGLDAVVNVRPAATRLAWPQLEAEVESCLAGARRRLARQAPAGPQAAGPRP